MLFVSGCNEEIAEKDTSEESFITNGILKFSDYSEFSSKASDLNSLSNEQLTKWCAKNGVVTQELLFRNLIDQEERHEQKVIEEFGSDITLDELNLKSIDPHSELYYELNDKVFIEESDEQGFTSYKAKVFNPVYMSVLNENGFVIINNELYCFDNTGYKVIHDCDIEKIPFLSQVCETNSELGISVYNFEISKKKGYGHSFNEISTRYESNRERVTFQAFFHAGDEGTYYSPTPGACMAPEFFVEAIAQKKNIWGNWVIKTNYTPIDKVTASWDHYYKLVDFDIYPPDYYYVTVDYPKTSPWTYDTFWGMGGTTNWLKVNCNPGGYWYCPPSDRMIDECNVFDYNFYLKATNYPDLTFSD